MTTNPTNTEETVRFMRLRAQKVEGAREDIGLYRQQLDADEHGSVIGQLNLAEWNIKHAAAHLRAAATILEES
jgi:hypothetical protein